ncbi:MAG: MotA/TolQ/ExbB proton channel family protein [Deltaproteobacteria bacterium]|nr:MotA/TolQ/ExbB proton channel family protein [Deltaproteobacteria bacterium]
MDKNLVALLKSSVALWVIIACSVIAIMVAVERLMALWRFSDRSRSLADAVTRALLRGDLEDGRAQCERSGSPAAEVFLAVLQARSPPPAGRRAPAPEKVAAAVERQRVQVSLKLRQNLWILGTIGATAPFVGLFGTVVGIMQAFHQMSVTGQGGFSVVAAGISEALITTAAGIAVAVEAVVIFNWLNTHVQKLGVQFKLLCEELVEIALEPAPAPAAPSRAVAPPEGA